MGQSGYVAEITSLSPNATEKDVYDFFSFCGPIEHVDVVRAGEYASTAYVTFKDAYALETAVLLSESTILDQRVCITRWGQDEFDIWNASSWRLEDESSSTHSQGSPFVPSAGEAVTMAQDVVKTMIATGYVVGKEALIKAKAFDESHQVSATAAAKVAELSERIGLADKICAGVEAVKSVDDRYHISDVTKSVANTVVSSSYFSAGALWVSDALSRAAKVAADFGNHNANN